MGVLLPVHLVSVTVDSLEGLFLIDDVCPLQQVTKMWEISYELQLSEILTSHNPYPFCLHTSLSPLSPQSQALVCAEVLSLLLLVRCQEL